MSPFELEIYNFHSKIEIKKNRVYRRTKTNEDPVWLVELKIPRKFVEKLDVDYLVDNDDNISIDDANTGADLTIT